MSERHFMCRHCDEFLPETSFYKNKSKPNGRETLCKVCWKESRFYNRQLEFRRVG